MAIAATGITVAWMWWVTNKFPAEKSKLMGVLIYSILSMLLFYFAFLAYDFAGEYFDF
jgi:hypothetical protein